MFLKAGQNAARVLKKTARKKLDFKPREISEILSLSAGVAEVSGLKGAFLGELIEFKNNVRGFVQTLFENRVGVVFLNNPESLKAGDEARRTNRPFDVPVGEELLGRVISPLGDPLDDLGPVRTRDRRPGEVQAPPIMARAAVDTPLQTGVKVIDAFTPIGRGQRELILGDRQTGKTALAVDTIISQKDTGVVCVYCAIGMQAAQIARVIDDFKKYDVLKNTVVVAAPGNDEAGMQYIAPYAATAIGEHFMHQGKDALIVYDDLTAHARAYRQISLLLRTPPGREAFPGDIFYIHSRLLERATRLAPEAGGGSLTALPIVSTEAGNISAYIPTNIISITDGQIYLSAALFQKGLLPAVDTGRSVSRVGGSAQLPAYRALTGPLKLFYAQFEELEAFAKFGTQLDAQTRRRLNRGEAIRAALQQRRYQVVPPAVQIALFLAATEGLLDKIDPADIPRAQEKITALMTGVFAPLGATWSAGEKPADSDKTTLLSALKETLAPLEKT